MKYLLFIVLFGLEATVLNAQKTSKATILDKNKKVMVVDASCGECQFGMKGKSCDLAVRINGKAYFVDGTGINQHGDAHAKNGFCNAVRKAEVQGEIAGNRFKATYFKLLPEEVKKAEK